ncbi:MAG TPA: fumarylacetoacetate hydrolase family protein [Firmicutes bacterium]|jgi:2-keto-4-pentenoate hydratase/2-oxohepta-3-ene-1,7-dioic acid hydratase in catechol pathway|nr:fumarylacetoacetate hydrolase family protein [Bacillota bacterium]
MKLVTYEKQGEVRIGIVVSDFVVDLSAGMDAIGEGRYLQEGWDMKTFLALENGLKYALQVEQKAQSNPKWLTKAGAPLDQVVLKAPITNPNKVIGIGLNYRDHAEETGLPLPKEPVIFGKYANAIIGPEENILLPTGLSDQVDYEAELAVVIGRRASSVAEQVALEYVAGYTNLNDVSARDLQMRDGQWMKGKCLDTFAPMGPWLVTKDEIRNPEHLKIELRLNGQTMQSSNTRNLIFGVSHLVSFLSKLMTLEPGDVIATGTPAGVGIARKPPLFLRPGDTVEVEIEGLGVLRNGVATKR